MKPDFQFLLLGLLFFLLLGGCGDPKLAAGSSTEVETRGGSSTEGESTVAGIVQSQPGLPETGAIVVLRDWSYGQKGVAKELARDTTPADGSYRLVFSKTKKAALWVSGNETDGLKYGAFTELSLDTIADSLQLDPLGLLPLEVVEGAVSPPPEGEVWVVSVKGIGIVDTVSANGVWKTRYLPPADYEVSIFAVSDLETPVQEDVKVVEYGISNFVAPFHVAEMRYAPGGSGTIGEADDGYPEVRNFVVVSVDEFLIDETEVSVGDYLDCQHDSACVKFLQAKDTGCVADTTRKDLPMNCVGVSNALGYCLALNKRITVEGALETHEFRLPTEAEWEFAAQLSDREAGDFCQYENLKEQDSLGCSDGFEFLAPVGSLLPNGLGLYDMLGNVAEWVLDAWSVEPPPTLVNPIVIQSGEQTVIKGGTFLQEVGSGLTFVASERRSSAKHTLAMDGVGFRCVYALRLDSVTR